MAIVSVNLTDTINSWRLKFNQIASNQGDLNSLTTTETSTLVGAINEINRGGVSPPLANLQDVRITNVADNQFVRYNVSTGMWENKFLDTGDITQFEAALSILESQITFSRTLATESYVDNAILDLINNAPEDLDTLNEIAEAINNDPDFYLDNATRTWVLNQGFIDSAGLGLSLVTENSVNKLRSDRRIQVPHGINNGVQFGFDDFDGGTSDVLHIYADTYSAGTEQTRMYLRAENDPASQSTNDKIVVWTPDANGFAHTTDGSTENVFWHAGNFNPNTINTSVASALDSLQAWVLSQGYIDGYDVSQEDVTDHQAALSITTSQISDLNLNDYVLSANLAGVIEAYGYATETYVDNGLDSLQGWVVGQNYLTQTGLAAYARQSYVDSGLDSLQGWVIGQNYLQSADLTGYLQTEENDLSSSVIWADVPDANITQSSVTQYQTAINTGTDAHLNNTGSITNGYVLSWNTTLSDYAWVAQTQAGGGISNVVEDTSPQLGGNLDLNSNDITGSGNIDITGNLTVSGTINAGDNITAYSTSDITLKENIRRIIDPYKIISQITGVVFDWTDEEIQSRGGIDDYFVRKTDVGVVAQQVMQVAPELVVKRPTTGKLAVKYEGLIPIMIEAIKDNHRFAKKRIAEREQKDIELEKKVEELTALVEKLQNNA